MKYPEDFINKIICGNHLQILSYIPIDSIDLTVTSPPYDDLRNYEGYNFKFKPLAKELYRITKIGGIIVWVVGDKTINGSETGTSFKQALYFKDVGLKLHDTMIYKKDGFSNPSFNRYHQIFEYMFILSKGIPKVFNPIKDRLNLWDAWGINTSRQIDGSLQNRGKRKTYKGQYGMRFNIWKYNVGGCGMSAKDKIAYQHPAIFPEKLAKDHILSWSNENDIILDPMCGSGTTCKMAKKYNRKYIGIDISKGYCEMAERIIADTHYQKELFKEA